MTRHGLAPRSRPALECMLHIKHSADCTNVFKMCVCVLYSRDDRQERHRHSAFFYAFLVPALRTMSRNSGLSDAPPTRKPSMSVCEIRPALLAACSEWGE